jgi:hypothetical protein
MPPAYRAPDAFSLVLACHSLDLQYTAGYE